MTRHELIADLLMGAAMADKHLDGRELDKVRALLCEAMRVKKLPTALDRRIQSFKANKLDVFATCDKLNLASDDEKRKLLELIVAVHDSDDLWDFDEDAYLRKVAAALRLAEDKWKDLAVQILSIESIGDALLPPPLPKA
jgi:uncharacterized tellurite resistance protein B-like protein